MRKKLIIYLIIILIFMILPFIEWKLEMNMSFSILANVMKNADFVLQWHYLTYANGKVFVLIYPVIITYFGLKDFFNLYHSGMLYSISERTDYKSYIKDTFLKIHVSNSWIYFTFIFLMLLVCSILFNYNSSELLLIGYGNINYLLFAFISALLSIVYSIFILNIGLIVTRYCKKFLITIIVSYLSFISFAIISETMVGALISSFIKVDGIYNSFSIFNIIMLDGNIFGIVIYSFILLLISSFIVYKVYSNKDKVLVEYE